ncbi:DUF4136 domain-containing protein [Chryseobacterium daecheongense]|uniref:Uncharacterized protein DUF4136 n=2 Tax=Chryseobacterium daecheongense TaxID=192389 RepID=A0ABY2FXV9_9FLAO|nr:uncharacterized protein DUF4136 [Chryseobacterium daecheongense]
MKSLVRKFSNVNISVMSKKYIFILLASAALSLTSCSPFQVRSDYAETANFNSYKTYKLRIDDLKLNDIDKDRVLNELSRQLQSKGLASGENPDLIINVKANHKKVTDITTNSPYGMWGWGGPFGWGVGVNRTWSSNYNEGALIIDLIDARTNKLVWQGIGSGISVDSPKAKQRQIPEIVAEIMANYPPQRK